MVTLTLIDGEAETTERVAVRNAVIAGWTGRDRAQVEHHIRELEALGVKPPPSTPVFYRVAASRLTTEEIIEVSGPDSGGEVEFVLLRHRERLWVGVGSDHTDRKVETYDVTVSKQMCDKPLGPIFWRYDDVVDHWDSLMMRAWIADGADLSLYQEGAVSAMLPPEELMARYRSDVAEGTAIFGGTLPAIGGVRPTGALELELGDPVLGRRLRHSYKTRQLPMF